MRISTRIRMLQVSQRDPRSMTVRRLLVLCCVCAALLTGLACSGEDKSAAEEAPAAANEPPTPADEPAVVNPMGEGAVEVATGFVEAFGAFDPDQAITYLADDADISGISGTGTLEEFRLLLSFLEGQGYKQSLDSCEEWGSSASGTNIRCTFDFHAIRSDEIGLGPFSGSYFVLAVRDGEIVRASLTWQTGEFSPQMWEPFAEWVSTAYPEDAAVMYTDESLGDFRLTEESIQRWEQRSREYVEEVGRRNEGAETSP